MNEARVYPNLTDEQYEMYLQMMILRGEKMEGYRSHILDRWFSIRRLTCPTIIGTFALTSIQTRQRWMLENETYLFDGIRCTPTDLARDYLAIKYPRKSRSRITTRQYRDFYDHRRNAPIYAQPGRIDNAVYIDIKSAYWSILKAVGWDVDYMPGGWLKVKSSVSDFPFPEIKMARNCLVSVAANTYGSMRIWTGKELIFKKSGNAYVNLALWSIVMDVLHAVAFECLSAGALYCYTDGFICPADRENDIAGIIASWGLMSDVKHRGDTHIKAAGSYAIGDFTTKRYVLNRERKIEKVIGSEQPNWLKKRFVHFANRAGI